MNAERWDRKHSFPPAGDHYNAHWLQVSIPPRPLEQRGRKYQNDLFTGALGSLQWRLLVLKHESRFYFTSMLPIICPFWSIFQVAWKHESRNVPGPCHLGRWWGGCSGAEWMRLTGWYSTVQYSTVYSTVQYSLFWCWVDEVDTSCWTQQSPLVTLSPHDGFLNSGFNERNTFAVVGLSF